MGYIQQANDIVENSTRLLDNILSSSFNQFIQGFGQPVLVKYWNLNDTETTSNNGTGTIDEDIGPESPNRYNCIDNFPIYGLLRDLIPEITQDDNLLDLDLNSECIILPDTIKPSPCDYFEYIWDGKHGKRSIIFKVNNVQLSTIKSNGYYKIECNMIDIDGNNRYRERINHQVVRNLHANPDKIGTNDKCIIESSHFSYIKRIESIIDDILTQYIDLFYSEKYNAVVCNKILHGDFLAYDPWVTKFIIQNNILSDRNKNPIMLVNYDENAGFRKKYNTTFFHAVEIRSLKYLQNLRFFPTSFDRMNTNPFAYYGEEVTFKLDIYQEEHTKYTTSLYMPITIERNIRENSKELNLNEFEVLMIDYFNKDNLSGILTNEIADSLEKFSLDYTEYWYQFTPILIYILKAICIDINNSYN